MYLHALGISILLVGLNVYSGQNEDGYLYINTIFNKMIRCLGLQDSPLAKGVKVKDDTSSLRVLNLMSVLHFEGASEKLGIYQDCKDNPTPVNNTQSYQRFEVLKEFLKKLSLNKYPFISPIQQDNINKMIASWNRGLITSGSGLDIEKLTLEFPFDSANDYQKHIESTSSNKGRNVIFCGQFKIPQEGGKVTLRKSHKGILTTLRGKEYLIVPLIATGHNNAGSGSAVSANAAPTTTVRRSLRKCTPPKK